MPNPGLTRPLGTCKMPSPDELPAAQGFLGRRNGFGSHPLRQEKRDDRGDGGMSFTSNKEQEARVPGLEYDYIPGMQDLYRILGGDPPHDPVLR